jgi:hypothetical protein
MVGVLEIGGRLKVVKVHRGRLNGVVGSRRGSHVLAFQLA